MQMCRECNIFETAFIQMSFDLSGLWYLGKAAYLNAYDFESRGGPGILGY